MFDRDSIDCGEKVFSFLRDRNRLLVYDKKQTFLLNYLKLKVLISQRILTKYKKLTNYSLLKIYINKQFNKS